MGEIDAHRYDLTKPWNRSILGSQILPLINDDAPIIRVEAGPGTGKTFGLIRRVVRIVHPDGLALSGKKVAVVAFNRVIAKQLRTDIEAALKGMPHDVKPVIETVHGFCLRFFREDIRILLPHEREAMVYDVLQESPALQRAFKQRRDAEQALRDHEASIRQNAQLWHAVEQWLARHKARLISDLPRLLLNRIRDGDFVDARYDHVIVDEFQDLTAAQQELFIRLRADDGQLIALGDPRQSVYAFLGNERKGLAKLNQSPLLHDVQIHDVKILECRRCPKEIVKAANKLMERHEAMPMIAASAERAEILVVEWKTPASEAKGMAKLIRTKIRGSAPDKKHLVIVTRRQFGYRLREELIKLDSSITIELGFSESILELWPVREAFLFFCLLVDPDAPTWRAWLGYRTPSATQDHNAPERNADAYLSFFARNNEIITHKAVLALAREKRSLSRGRGGSFLWDRACRYKELYHQRKWKALEPEKLIAAIFDPGLWIKPWDKDVKTATLDFELLKVNALQLLEGCKHKDRRERPKEKLRQIAKLLRYIIATREALTDCPESMVKLTTLWGAKGLTADYVYVVGLCREAIPAKRSQEYPGTDRDYFDEQRRLFYVTITRSKQELVLSRPLKIKPNEAKQLNLHVGVPDFHHCTLQKCPFLENIRDELPRALDGESLLHKNKARRSKTADGSSRKTISRTER